MKPVLALIGRPNVGKSTLFNRLTAKRTALVADEPGVTRDRLYGDGIVGEGAYLVVDTGGLTEPFGSGRIEGSTDALAAMVGRQINAAINEADGLIFLVDYRSGRTAADGLIANHLRRAGKPIWLAVNKAEGVDADTAAADFHPLGLGAPHTISAGHGDGVRALMTEVLAAFPQTPEPPSAIDVPRFAVVGRPNVGKSTLINALIGEERVIVSGESGTTRDRIEIPLGRGDKQFILIDTAGVRRRHSKGDAIERIAVVKTMQAVDAADVVILLLDAQAGIHEQDAALAGYFIEHGRSLVLAVNKWDLLDADARDDTKREIARKLAFADYASPYFISALKRFGIESMVRAVHSAFAAADKNLSTSKLTKALQRATRAVPPPMVRGRRARLKHAHQGGKRPPLIVVYGSHANTVPLTYRRYLAKSIRSEFRLVGTPVRIELRQTANRSRKRTGPGRAGSARRKPGRKKT
jgi:GTP-binding protein